jgi:hypothetical protein
MPESRALSSDLQQMSGQDLDTTQQFQSACEEALRAGGPTSLLSYLLLLTVLVKQRRLRSRDPGLLHDRVAVLGLHDPLVDRLGFFVTGGKQEPAR